MTTYNAEYYYNPPRRKKQRYALIERVIDFEKLPVVDRHGNTVAWKKNDVLQAMTIRAGQTVLGVRLEILRGSPDIGDRISLGYGTVSNYWGDYIISKNKIEGNLGYKVEAQGHASPPLYFSSTDTLDIIIGKAALQGKIRIIAHVLEDDR